jgi:hypothetical protein
MPIGLVEHHDGVLVGCQLVTDPVEEEVCRSVRDDRHHQSEPPAGDRLHRAE